MRIGMLTQDQDGNISGRIQLLGIGVLPVTLEKQTSKKDGKPYFRIIADPNGDAYEIGAAFERNKDGMVYHSVSIDSPVFSVPLNAALFSDREHDGVFNIVWDRPKDKPKHGPALGTKAETSADTNNGDGAAVDADQANGAEPPAAVAASSKHSNKRRVFSKGATP